MKNLTATEVEERIKQQRFEDRWLEELLDGILEILKEKENEHNQPSNGQTR